MASFWESMVRDLTGRGMFGGKFQIRLILQPLAAIVLGLRAGIADGKAGRAPFIKDLVLAAEHRSRRSLLREAVRDAIIPLCVAFLIDSILQYLILHRVRPLVAVIVGGLLVFLPFVITRALANRAWTHGHRGTPRTAGRA